MRLQRALCCPWPADREPRIIGEGLQTERGSSFHDKHQSILRFRIASGHRWCFSDRPQLNAVRHRAISAIPQLNPMPRPAFLPHFPIAPCLPKPAEEPPPGPGWIHEIKHDGFRILARRDKDRVRLVTRNGYDFTARYPKIVTAVESLPVASCVVDGEAIVVNEHGLSVFDILRYRLRDDAAVLCAFDLIEVDGADLRRRPLGIRVLPKLLAPVRTTPALLPTAT